jgi:hypothetical protein
MANQNLVEKLLEASQSIHKSSLRGSGNYIVTSPGMMSLFRSRLRMDKIKRIFNE